MKNANESKIKSQYHKFGGKILAIRQAVKDLGSNASAKDIQNYCKNTLHVVLSYSYTASILNSMDYKLSVNASPKISLSSLASFKEMIEREGGASELSKILSKAKLLSDLSSEVGGWDKLEEVLKLLS